MIKDITVSNMIVRRVSVNRTRSPQEALAATGREQYVDLNVVNTMPNGKGEEIFFFTLGRYISDDDLEKEYELLALRPADPYLLSAYNEADPSFADEYPNNTHWKNSQGRWCHATFSRQWFNKRIIIVYDCNIAYHNDQWFAGCRKSA